jgi:putative tryptophan/tyrosine transport system substrate-binding protein
MRRTLVSLLTAAALCTSAQAQSQGKVYRLGVLAQVENSLRGVRSFVLPELAKLGFAEGVNLVTDLQAGEVNALPQIAREMMSWGPDAILTIATPSGRAARQATSTIPIVHFGGEDAVSEGLVQSVPRPGGNITGVVILSKSLDAKRLELLVEAVPAMRRIAILLYPFSPIVAEEEQQFRAAAASAGVEVLFFQAAGPDEYPAAFAAMTAAGAQGVIIGANPTFFAHTEMLTALALQAQLPTICEWASMAKQGCLIGYGPHRAKLYQVTARQLAQILEGVRPEAIPVEQPAVFEFGLNLRIARALNLDLPPDLSARADEVIE